MVVSVIGAGVVRVQPTKENREKEKRTAGIVLHAMIIGFIDRE
jgi:hypothetical protein